MQAVEFEATITDGVVHIPKEYKALQNNVKATFVVMYEAMKPRHSKNEVEKELDTLFAQSDNKVQVTMELATDTSGMMDDGIL